MSFKYKPKGYHDVTASLVVTDAESTIKFAQNVFDAIVVERMEDHGKIWHA